MPTKKPAKPIVEFVVDYEVQDERAGTEAAECYKAGQRKAMEPASAAHFVNRGVAVYVKGGPEA